MNQPLTRKQFVIGIFAILVGLKEGPYSWTFNIVMAYLMWPWIVETFNSITGRFKNK